MKVLLLFLLHLYTPPSSSSPRVGVGTLWRCPPSLHTSIVLLPPVLESGHYGGVLLHLYTPPSSSSPRVGVGTLWRCPPSLHTSIVLLPRVGVGTLWRCPPPSLHTSMVLLPLCWSRDTMDVSSSIFTHLHGPPPSVLESGHYGGVLRHLYTPPSSSSPRVGVGTLWRCLSSGDARHSNSILSCL